MLAVSVDDLEFKYITSTAIRLTIDQHYVYSVTAAESLSCGYENGLLILRSVLSTRRRNGQRVVNFDAIPLIIGSGVLKL